MLYKKKTFTVPASAGNETLCDSVGQHCGPDAKGRCLRCGERIASVIGHEDYCNAPKGGACGCKTVILPPFRTTEDAMARAQFDG